MNRRGISRDAEGGEGTESPLCRKSPLLRTWVPRRERSYRKTWVERVSREEKECWGLRGRSNRGREVGYFLKIVEFYSYHGCLLRIGRENGRKERSKD